MIALSGIFFPLFSLLALHDGRKLFCGPPMAPSFATSSRPAAPVLLIYQGLESRLSPGGLVVVEKESLIFCQTQTGQQTTRH